jgi:beta-1,4-mannosyltransferase
MSEQLVVLQSFPAPRPTTNPYLVMLRRAVSAVPGAQVRTFSWRTALLGRYDVFHVHWPEILVSGHSPVKKLVRQVLFLLFLARLRLLRIPIVRTVHNLELPQGISRREVALLRLIDRQTRLRITINATTVIPEGQPSVLIPHGHYRDWFAEHPQPESVPGRFAYVGLIRRYKGVDTLLRAFRETSAREGLSLHVSGRPSSEELATTLRDLASPDPRISLKLAFLSDAELVAEVREAEVVVLPYREMHNSGGTLAALSLSRPVLVPDNEVNRLLAEEVGAGWVHTYRGQVTADDLLRTIDAVHERPDAGQPDLSRRSWEEAGIDHVRAYREARAAARRRRWPVMG